MKKNGDFSDRFDATSRDNSHQSFEPKKRGRFWRRFAIVVVLTTIVCVGGTALYLRRFQTPIDVENATPEKLVGWLALRDLSEETPETRAALFEKYFNSVASPPQNGKPRQLNISDDAKRFAAMFLSNRDLQIENWTRKHARPPFLRLDYVVVRSKTRTSEFATSDEVRPGPALLARWNERQTNSNQSKKKTTNAEKNIKTLIMQWFVAKYREYDATPDVDKPTLIDRFCDELLNLQTCYNELRAVAKLPPQTRARLLQEFEETVDGWLDVAKPDELAKILWFKDLLISAIVAREMNFGRLFRAQTADGTSQTFGEVVSQLSASIGDALRDFVFVDSNANDEKKSTPRSLR